MKKTINSYWLPDITACFLISSICLCMACISGCANSNKNSSGSIKIPYTYESLEREGLSANPPKITEQGATYNQQNQVELSRQGLSSGNLNKISQKKQVPSSNVTRQQLKPEKALPATISPKISVIPDRKNENKYVINNEEITLKKDGDKNIPPEINILRPANIRKEMKYAPKNNEAVIEITENLVFKIEDWSSPGEISISDNNTVIVKFLGAKPGGKTAIASPMPDFDYKKYHVINLAAKTANKQTMLMAALSIKVNGEYCESKPIKVSSGESTLLVFDLDTPDWKCAKSDWVHNYKIPEGAKITDIGIVFYNPQKDESVSIENVFISE